MVQGFEAAIADPASSVAAIESNKLADLATHVLLNARAR